MNEDLIIKLTSIIVLGGIAQWIAWRIHFPAILMLLVLGFIAGPVTGFLNPEELFGDFFYPLISLSVAVILFEGGLSLRYRELSGTVKTVRNLVSIGILVTWIVGFTAAYLLLNLDFKISLLFGAILVVSGPTVIVPLLKHLRLTSRIGSIIKWEGIANDPIGALLAVLVFGVILIGNIKEASAFIVLELIKIVFAGIAVGFIGAVIVIIFIKKYWIPYFLQNPMVLMVVVVVFTASNSLQPESGLIAVTIMGLVLANQKYITLKHVVEFKEILSILLVSSLFIILSAGLKISDLKVIKIESFLFLLVLIFFARPMAVLLSTIGSKLDWRERIFLFWMAPRGIVAAAVSSIFALRLEESGYAQAYLLMPLTFFVIIGTVTIYGLTCSPVARLLKIAEPNPQGVLIIGAHPWARAIAKCLQRREFRVLMADTNRENISDARMEGIPAYYGSVLSENIFDEIDLGGIGRLFALTSNDEVNNLSTLHFLGIFDKKELYHLPSNLKKDKMKDPTSPVLSGRILFGKEISYDYLTERFTSGSEIKCTPLTEKFTYDEFKKLYGETAIPLFLVNNDVTLEVFALDNIPTPEPGQTLISLVEEK